MGLRTYQDWCIDTLYFLLKRQGEYRGSVRDQGYIYVIKSIITHYASMYYVGRNKKLMRNKDKEHLNLWWDHLNCTNKNCFYTPLLRSESAQKELNEHSEDIKEQKKGLRLEHITPGGYIYRRLCAKRDAITKDIIREELKYNKLVLLTREEAKKYLDGEHQCFESRDIDCFIHLFSSEMQLDKKELKSAIGKSAKSYGDGLLRMARLLNHKVKFYNSKGEVCSPREIVSYFDEPMVL